MPWNTITSYVTGQKVTALVWDDVVENFEYLEEVGYQEFATTVDVTASTEGTAASIVSLGSLTYEAVLHEFEFYCPGFNSSADGTILHLVLFEGATAKGDICQQSNANRSPAHGRRRLTPTAGAHTYSVKAYLPTGTGNVRAGNGTAGNAVPGSLRVRRVVS